MTMGKLYFISSYNEKIFIGECEKDKALSKIKKYVEEINPDFKIYYCRMWEEDGVMWYDVGSHTEFFCFES